MPKRVKDPSETIFFNQKEKDRAFEEERLRNLEKLREKYTPINFESIKEHERSFMANVYMKKQEREKDLKSKMKNLETAYKSQVNIQQPSKAYMSAKEDYTFQRQGGPQSKKIAESMESRERIKKYNEKLRAMNAAETPATQPKDPMKVTKGESVYGRFGREWEKKLHGPDQEQKYLEDVKEKGMEYMKFAKAKAVKKPEGAAATGMEPIKQEEPNYHNKANEIGKEYLKFAKSKAAKHGVDLAPIQGVEVAGLKGDEQAFVKARLGKIDGDLVRIETKVRNKLIDKDSEEVEETYLKNIKAKLDLLAGL